MYLIHNQEREITGYYFNNMLINKEQTQVCGIVLGNCIFGNSPSRLGKYFNDTFWRYDGYILATTELAVDAVPPNKLDSLTLQAWQFVNTVKDHTDVWIKETNKWSDKNLWQVLALG